MPAQTITDILDYTVRVSSREAYVSPTRGAQGNALKTLLAMPFALDGEQGETLIEAGGAAHRIAFAVDRIRQEPKTRLWLWLNQWDRYGLLGQSPASEVARSITPEIRADVRERLPRVIGWLRAVERELSDA